MWSIDLNKVPWLIKVIKWDRNQNQRLGFVMDMRHEKCNFVIVIAFKAYLKKLNGDRSWCYFISTALSTLFESHPGSRTLCYIYYLKKSALLFTKINKWSLRIESSQTPLPVLFQTLQHTIALLFSTTIQHQQLAR